MRVACELNAFGTTARAMIIADDGSASTIVVIVYIAGDVAGGETIGVG